MQPTELNQSKADALNAQPGTLTGIDCDVCHNKGYVAVPTEKGIATKECECMKARRSKKSIETSGLSYILTKYTFDTYKDVYGWQKEVKEIAMKYARVGRSKWFIASGRPGSGKTHICTAICGELLNKNREVQYMMWRSDAPRLKSYINDYEKYSELFNRFARAEILYIDDFFKGEVTQADKNLAFEILNYRYINNGVGTIISSELTVEEILDIDEAIGSRIAERTIGYAVRTGDENIRLAGAVK